MFKRFLLTAATAFGLAVMAFSPAAQALSPDYSVDVNGTYASPNPVNPDREVLNVEYYLDSNSYVDVYVYHNNGTYVETLQSGYVNAGWQATTWNGYGYYYGDYATSPAGNYRVEVNARNDYGYTDVENYYFDVNYNGYNTYGDVYNVSFPSEFQLEVVAYPWFNYSLNGEGQVAVNVYNDNNGSFTRELLYEYQYNGNHEVTWDGRDYNGYFVEPGTYRVEFQVTDNRGNQTDFETHYIYATQSYNNYAPDVQDLRLNSVNEYNNSYEFTFFLTEKAQIDVRVHDLNGNFIRQVENANFNSGSHYVFWDGRDESGYNMPNGEYELSVYASNNSGNDKEWLNFYKEGGPIVPAPPVPGPTPFPPYDNCAGFWDVDRFDAELCDALNFVRDAEIFGGYADGSFRPNDPINRAEITKVILRAFNIDVMAPSNTNLGFADVEKYSWYQPFLRTAKRFGIVQGYPDRTFRPANNMNRAEFVKTFLTASGLPIPTCVRAPFADTVNDETTAWYIDFACFSKAHNLIDYGYDNNFFPEANITRGEVAKLFYRFHRAGLFERSVTPPISHR